MDKVKFIYFINYKKGLSALDDEGVAIKYTLESTKALVSLYKKKGYQVSWRREPVGDL